MRETGECCPGNNNSGKADVPDNGSSSSDVREHLQYLTSALVAHKT